MNTANDVLVGRLILAIQKSEDKMIEPWIQNPCSEEFLYSKEPMLGFSDLEIILYKAGGPSVRYFLLAAQSFLLENNPTKNWEYNRYWDDWATLASFLCVMSEEDLRMYLSLY